MRLDQYLNENKFYSSRTKALQAIEREQVTVNGVVKKASYVVKGNDCISVVEKQKFVSNGGYKLEKALDDFNFNVEGLVCADIGASTGGFTDCLLQRGAKKVYAVDVGQSLLDEKLQKDQRVIAIDNVNARFLTEDSLDEKVDCAVVDCSFISLKLLLNAIMKVVKLNGFIIALIKPQFECGRKNLNKNGIVCDDNVKKEVCEDIFEFALKSSINPINFTNAPIKEGKNCEFLILLNRQIQTMDKQAISKVILR